MKHGYGLEDVQALTPMEQVDRLAAIAALQGYAKGRAEEQAFFQTFLQQR